MITLERYEELHVRYPWLVWLPVADRRSFAQTIEAAASDEERQRLAAWWQGAVQRSLAMNPAADPDVHFPTAA